MHYTSIVANGDIPITIQQITQSSEVSVHAPADIGGATIDIGWLDAEEAFNAYDDGALLVGESKRYRCGEGVRMVAQIAGYSTAFKIGYAN